MSWLKNIRKKIHTTPILREVSQGFANTFGMGSAYTQFDAELGIGQGGTTTAAQGNVMGNLAADALLAKYQREPYDDGWYDGRDEPTGEFYDDDVDYADYDVELR
jgi:hypothetical protein